MPESIGYYRDMVVAIDYDGVITHDVPFPKAGCIQEGARIYIPKLYEMGYTLVLWTARSDPYFTEAVNRLMLEGLWQYFSTDWFRLKAGRTGKIEADFYLDDRMAPGPFDWDSAFNYIVSKRKEGS